MPIIERIVAREILDSRGRPTVAVTCGLHGGAMASASVPSGASTGSAEAMELRDGDPGRYRGLGCRKAVANVNGPIAAAVLGRKMSPDQAELDNLLIELDGTPNKLKLGANAILAVSLAFARATAAQHGVPLYQHFADMIGQPLRTLPRMTINLFSGGKHAGGQMPIQDILLVPSATTIDRGLADVFAVFYAAADLTKEKYHMRSLRADEGGLAPPFASIDDALADAVEAIRRASLEPGKDVAIALDVASSHFYADGLYDIGIADPRTPPVAEAGEDARAPRIDSVGMVEIVRGWVRKYPIVSVEDGLAEEDWGHWPALKQAIGNSALVLGDDFLCTNPKRIKLAIDGGCCSALLLKVNQIGTLTEAAEARRLAKEAGWMVTVSARSGETEDSWLADLAVAWGDQIKVGSVTQSERLAKYNRLLEIEAETGLPVVKWPG